MAALAAVPVKRSRQGRTCSPAQLPALLRLERCAAEEAAGLKLVGGCSPAAGTGARNLQKLWFQLMSFGRSCQARYDDCDETLS